MERRFSIAEHGDSVEGRCPEVVRFRSALLVGGAALLVVDAPMCIELPVEGVGVEKREYSANNGVRLHELRDEGMTSHAVKLPERRRRPWLARGISLPSVRK